MSDLSNMDLGQYHLLEVIRHGGMATVYKAYQASLDRYVAVKVLANSPDPQFAARFKREARAIAQLQHPNILPIYDYGEQEGLLYLVVQYIENGTTLGDMQGTIMEPVAALRIIERVLSALDYAHQRGIIHRDIKPSNILMPSPTWPLLADFGIAKIMNAGDGQSLTMSGVFIGTPAYVAPEQVLGNAIDVRTDLYSMGVVLYEMVTGRGPFDANTPMTMLTKHAYEPPPSPRTINPDLPPVVEPVLLRALAKDPADRYQSATTMAEALGRVAVQIEQGRSSDQHAALYQAGLRAFEEGRWDLAVERLRELVAQAPGYEDVADLLVAAQDAQVRTKTEARLQLERVQQRRQSGQPTPVVGTTLPPPVGAADPLLATVVPAPLGETPLSPDGLAPPPLGDAPMAAAGIGAAAPAGVRVAVQPAARPGPAPWLAVVALVVLVLGGGIVLGLSNVLGGTGPGGAGPTATTTPGDSGMEMGGDAASLGTLRFSDGSSTLDEVSLVVDKLPAPAPGTQYEAWLLGQGGELRQSLRGLTLDATGHGELVYRDPQGRNLLALFNRLEITVEPDPDPNPSSSRNVAFSGEIPPMALEHIGHLLVAFQTTEAQTALTVGLVQQATILNDTAQALLAAQKAGDLATMRREAEGLVNLIAGPTGQGAGDLDGDGTLTNPGDGFGLLLNGDNAGYIEGTLDHAKLSAEQPDATANIKLHAAHVEIAAENLSGWAVELRDRATRLAAATDPAAASEDAGQLASLADRFLNGKDLDGNEIVDPVVGEAGAKTAYQHARYLADIAVLPTGGGGISTRTTATQAPMVMATAYTTPDGDETPPARTAGPAPPTATVALPPPETEPPLPTATAPPPPPTATALLPTDTPPPPTATAVPPPPTATPNLVPIGSARFRDSDSSHPLAQITGTLVLPAPPAGQTFYAWLVNSSGGAPVSLGRLVPDTEGRAAFAFTDPAQANLLAVYDTVLITAEALETTPTTPSDAVAFRGQVPPQALEHIRHLLVGFDEAPNKVGLARGLYEQVGALYHDGELLNKAYGAGDFAAVKAAAEQAVNLIEGAHGAHFGDLDHNGQTDSGDGFGLLPNGDQPGYLLAVKDHAALAAALPDATDGIKQHATGVAITADNVQGWVTTLRDRALTITQAPDLKSTIGPLSDIMTLANNAYYGLGVEADSQPQPVAGSGGAFTLYQEALGMAELPIR